MTCASHLSKHAVLRCDQRTSLSDAAIKGLLDRRTVVLVGNVPGFNREHLLFYSAPDDRCFIAVRDRLCGTVVTVLPLDYHDAWTVTQAQCDQAKGLYEQEQMRWSDERARAALDVEVGEDSCITPSTFLITANVLSEGRFKATALFKRPGDAYGFNLARLFRDPTLLTDALARLSAKGVAPQDVLAINARLGKKGQPVSVSVIHHPCGTVFDERDLPTTTPVNDPDLLVRPRSYGR